MSALKYWHIGENGIGEWKYVTVPLVGQPVYVDYGQSVVNTSTDGTDQTINDVVVPGFAGKQVTVIAVADMKYQRIGGTQADSIQFWIDIDGDEPGERNANRSPQWEAKTVPALHSRTFTPAGDFTVSFRMSGGNGFFQRLASSIQVQVFVGGPVILDNRYAKKDVGYQYVETVYYTSDGTFNKADYPDLRAVKVRLVGGGGGGGAPHSSYAAPGGGGGGYAEAFILADALGASETVTVGQGGAGGIGPAGHGVHGTNSYFGSHCMAGRGYQGNISTYRGGASSSDGIGDFTSQGGHGGSGSASTNSPGGIGGSSYFGGAGEGDRSINPSGGGDAIGYGGGGGGGVAGNDGGAGHDGVVIVEVYA